jgi:ankyrin repeat protein
LNNSTEEVTDAQGRTALSAAAHFGHLDVLDALLSAGANVNVCEPLLDIFHQELPRLQLSHTNTGMMAPCHFFSR